MQAVVNELNTQKLSWTAKVYTRFVGKSTRQMNMFAGLQRSAKEAGSRKMSNLQLRGPESAKDAKARKELPTSFDWRDVNSSSWLTPNIDQGDCGSCYPEIDRCTVQCDMNTVSKHRVSSFEYIGGYYGGGTELGMMQEVYKNGPVVVSLEPGNDFMYYNQGIYRSTPVKHSEWVKVDHSVLLIGWGEEAQGKGKPLKYWIVQNS